MTEGHPAPGLLEAFMRNEVAAPDRLRIVRHLLSGCPQCVAVTRRIWGLGEFCPLGGGVAEAAYLEALEGLDTDRCPRLR